MKKDEKNAEFEKFDADYRRLIGQAIIAGLVKPSTVGLGGIDSFLFKPGDYNQDSGDYTQSTGGSHEQNSGSYTQS